MTLLLWMTGLLLAGALIYLARLPGRFDVQRSLLIRVPSERVYDKVRDLRSWPEWSPWLLHEPETRTEFSAEPGQAGGWYTWDGRLTGAGRLTHVELEPVRSIRQEIEFTRPYKSRGTVAWSFAPAAGGTEVTWSFQGRMPFLLRFLVPAVTRALGLDYELGLAQLRGCLDPAAETPRIAFAGPEERAEQTVLGLPFSARFEELGAVMAEAYPRLMAVIEERGLPVTGAALAIYDRVDVRRRTAAGLLALPIAGGEAPAGFTLRRIPGGRYFKTTLRGPYDFLELAWDSSFKHLRMKKLAVARGRPVMEVYENDPKGLASRNDIETSLYVPLR